MSKDSTVQVSADNLSKNQWGQANFLLGFFLKENGIKKELDKKKVTIALVTGCALLLILQIILEPEANTSTLGKSDISAPSEVLSTEPIPEVPAHELVRTSSGKSKSPLKLTGIQIIKRPRDLQNIPPGTFVLAQLKTGASNGLVKAELKENLRVNGTTTIEKGSTLIGQGSSTEERLIITFNQVVFKDGTFGQVNAVACDQSDKIVGLKGSKVGQRALNIAGGLGLGFLGGFSTALQDTQGQQGVAIAQPSLKNALLSGTATAALEQSQNFMAEAKNQTNILEIPPETLIWILFGEAR